MIFCVDKSVLKTSEKVQKDLNLEDLLLNHTNYYDTEEEALKDDFIPLSVCTSIRSVYSNLIVENTDGRYYSYESPNFKLVHKGYDLLMFLTSMNIFAFARYDRGFDELMLKHSQFYPIGLYYNGKEPTIYTQTIFSDKGIEKFAEYLKDGAKLVYIPNMNYEGNERAILNEIIFVEEITDEHNYNYN